ncbi:hypothetical protein GLOTRDRAFT_57027 [Gloeophyllum trabeum ATCC 11539]|uniref:Mitochondrial escape protein 2 n=1 Tax=Gloeophyllum trabeum (strain ATCC 11539 / FP-39264 / Madison 617) TaxID=670483 RepID=S7QEJ9_GLOTA|nr:uncharacterized protein GLOTRDRAFT_57027 [Gloeophyllum trabeum ATCC 11539]EPQ58246.1 hypothetical protein GLOTRDRAFT_57027 [Gloeophyllum trabeum ATCC 11539]
MLSLRRDALLCRRVVFLRDARINTRRCLADAAGSSATSSSSSATPPVSRPEEEKKAAEAWLFADSVFPVRLATWDLRHYIGIFREETILAKLKHILQGVNAHGFELVSLEPHFKDGGVFIHFRYNASEGSSTLEDIEKHVRDQAAKQGGVPSWSGVSRGSIWLVKGHPWREDMHRFASPMLTVAFEGPDVPEESLYRLLRPFGRMQDLRNPSPVPAGSLRFSTIFYNQVRSATIAKNVIHGLAIPSTPSGGRTILRLGYREPLQAHVIRDWIFSHPRIVLPIVVFFLGTLTYTVFDPIRAFMIQGKVQDWFDYKQSRIYRWVRANTVERFALSSVPDGGRSQTTGNVWKEREDAEDAVSRYLSEMPSSVAFVHGPQGSGKSTMLTKILNETGRKALIIDCSQLFKANSDINLVASLADQTGYWPVFRFMDSLNSLIDMASVGLIGQKAGFSTSLTDQVKQVLEVTGTALRKVSASYRQNIQRQVKNAQLQEQRRLEEARKRERIENGEWHDPRLDCIAGNGVMSELGIGDETMDPDYDMAATVGQADSEEERKQKDESRKEAERQQKSIEDVQAVESLPIVILKNFESKGGGKEEVVNVLAQWAATLAESQVAHVIVVSDNRENAKSLTKALPTKPLTSVALEDADTASALSFVQQKLRDAGLDYTFTKQQTAYVERLGGRASDLETLIHKVRSGQDVEEAVEDIIDRGVAELRKNAFGEDADDVKNLPWTREQAWSILKRLSKETEVAYHEVLMDSPFKDNEAALRNMEHAELISITTRNGRPSTIRPGKPVYKYVFERLVNDRIFQATQDITLNEKALAGAEATIRACEEELTVLKQLGSDPNHWLEWRSASSARAAYLFKKMKAAETKIEALEKQNAELKKVLAKGR